MLARVRTPPQLFNPPPKHQASVLSSHSSPQATSPQPGSTVSGALFAVGAYGMWGLVPLYYIPIAFVGPLEILVHRSIWTMLTMVLLVLVFLRGRPLGPVMANPRLALPMITTGLIIGGNWLIFTWAVTNERVLETSLGYFINPLLNVLLGVVLLGERLRPLQTLAVGIAATAVLIRLVSFGTLPWVSLSLAFSFALYGLFRKRAPVDPLAGLLCESFVLLPLALGYFAWLAATGASAFVDGGMGLKGYLALAGPVTAAPLALFAAAAHRLPLSALGFVQYLAPSLSFLSAVFLLGEPFGLEQLVTFGLIWAALVVFLSDAIRHNHRQRRLVAA